MKRGNLNLLFWLLPFVSLLPAALARAEEGPENPVFNPVITTEARTIPKGRVVFSRNVMASVNSSVLPSTLSLGILPRLEVGTAPFEYGSNGHKYNVNAKLNFYRGSQFDWSIAYSESRFSSAVLHQSGELILSSIQLATNWHPTWGPFAIGAFYGSTCGYINDQKYLVLGYSFRCKDEVGADLQWAISDKQWLTVGVGRLRKNGNKPVEPVTEGIGAAYTHFFPGKFFSRPTIGLYSARDQKILLVVSTTFNER